MFQFDLKVVELPLISKFRGINKREIALFEGPAGWSEFSPFPEYGAIESALWLKAAISGATNSYFNNLRNEIEINALLPNVEKSEVKNLLAKYPGCKTVKIKINDFKSDRDLVIEVLNNIPEANFRLDVNGQWSLSEAIENLNNYDLEFGEKIDYVEQPCLEFKDLQELRKHANLKIAVDESIRKNLNSDFSILKSVADIAILKWAPSGGVNSALEIAEQINLPIVISSALESSIGISHGLSLAQCIPNLYGPCGLGSASLFEYDVTSDPFKIENGKLLNRKISPDLISKFEVRPDRLRWWQNRIEQIYREGLL